MSDRLCARRCRLPRRHTAECVPVPWQPVACTCACHRDARHCSERGACIDHHDPACRGCRPAPAEHGDLCWRCHRRLQLVLHDMPTVYDWVMVHLPAGSRPVPRVSARIRRTKGAPPLPIDVEVMDIGDQILAILGGWVDALVDGTSLSGPRDRRTVTTLANYLLTHLTAVENQPWIIDAWTELTDVTSQAHALAPWREELTRCAGIPCPECQQAALAVFGGQTDVQCLACGTLIPQERYNLWTRILADEVSA